MMARFHTRCDDPECVVCAAHARYAVIDANDLLDDPDLQAKSEAAYAEEVASIMVPGVQVFDPRNGEWSSDNGTNPALSLWHLAGKPVELVAAVCQLADYCDEHELRVSFIASPSPRERDENVAKALRRDGR